MTQMEDHGQSNATDPFAHLHDEGFEAAYDLPLLTERDAVFAGREWASLDGDWHFVLDPFREGLRQRWFAFDDTPMEDWTVPRDYDDGAWQTLPVPGCWNLARPDLFRYEGAAWYSRDFEADPAPGLRLILRAGAISGRARIFLNGQFLGLHRGGFTPVFADLTPALVPGRNHVMIEVDTTRRADGVPMHHVDWFNYGGLFREVAVARVPTPCITRFHLRLEKGRVHVEVALSEPADGTARLEIPSLGTGEVAVRGGLGEARFDWAPELWSPETPQLYDATLTFGSDTVTDRVGFRRIERQGTQLLLNGRPIRLRGICVHEDDRDTGRATSEADIRRRFAHIRDLGGNAARLAHYPHHELAAQIADEEGILLWEEVPVYWAIAFDNPDTLADARTQLAEMIRRDENRASVILWGIGNENADTDARLAFMRALAAAARALDPSRLVAAACLIDRERFCIADRLAEDLDVIGVNEYFGWYEPGLENLDRLLANSTPDRPVVISETGAEAAPGRRGQATQLFTEDMQAAMLSGQVARAAATPWMAGIFPWLLYDFRSERRQTRHQRGWNRKGVIAEDKATRKLGFAALAAAYRDHFGAES